MKVTYVGLPAALLSVSLFAACQNTARGVEQDTERNTAKAAEESREARADAERAADATKNSLERAADATQDAAGRAVDATKDAAREVASETREAARDIKGETKDTSRDAASATDAAQQTLQIKTALIDADNVDAAGIDVDTDGRTKTVTLKGHVPTAAQKATAERIAKAKAPSYQVVNQIAVR